VVGLINAVLGNVGVILAAPFQDPSLIWQIAPIFLLWGVMMFYFGTHKHEKLGWNTALGNGISLFWIIISAMQFIFSNSSSEFTYTKFFLIMVIAIYAIFIIIISFKHTFSDKFTYALASPSPVYYFSAIVLLYAHDLFSLSFPMLIAITALFVVLLIILRIFRLFLPEMKEEDNNMDSFDSKDSFGDIGGSSKSDTAMDDFKFDESSSPDASSDFPQNTPISSDLSASKQVGQNPSQSNNDFDDLKF